jgi:hypothetical protein
MAEYNITPIDGGICAAAGFKAAGIHAGFRKNKQKKDLAKSKGLKLQDLLDHALDEALGFSYYPMSELRLLEIDNEIESLKIQKEKAMRDCQKKIDILISGLIEFKEEEAAQYDRKIRQLELEKEYNKQMLYKD